MNRNIKILLTVLGIFVIFLPTLSKAQTNGAITGLSFQPKDPIVLDNVTVTIEVTNTGSDTAPYSLKLTILNEGRILDNDSFTFTLKPGGKISFSPTYSPQTIGQYEIVVELFDKYGMQKFDSNIADMNVVSTIGPFDLSIDIPSNIVEPSSRIPALLSITNMGEKGTDVDVELSIPCINESSITKEFFVFVGSHSTYESNVPIDSCNEYGAHRIDAKVKLFNKTWISASSIFFENDTVSNIDFDAPDSISLHSGDQVSYVVRLTNIGSSEIHNVKLIIGKLPVSWAEIEPDAIAALKPNNTGVFLVNITIPSDATAQNFTFGFYAASDEIVKRIQSNFVLTPYQNNATDKSLSHFNAPQITFSNFLIVFFILLVCIIILALRSFSTHRKYSSALDRIRGSMKR